MQGPHVAQGGEIEPKHRKNTNIFLATDNAEAIPRLLIKVEINIPTEEYVAAGSSKNVFPLFFLLRKKPLGDRNTLSSHPPNNRTIKIPLLPLGAAIA